MRHRRQSRHSKVGQSVDDTSDHLEKPIDAVHLGQVCGVHGVHGWIKIFSYTRPKENIFNFPLWLLTDNEKCFQVTLRQGRTQGKGLVAQLSGYDQRDMAESLIGDEIWIHRNQLAPLIPGEYYWSDLVGMSVWLNDQCLGKVKTVMETGANDVLVVQGDRERLIPFLQPDVIKRVALDLGRIEVDWDPDF